MSDRVYSSSDAFLVAFIRRQGIDVRQVAPDPTNPRRMRVSLDLSDEQGKKYEVEYRNSDYRRFVAEYQDTVDMIKRR